MIRMPRINEQNLKYSLFVERGKAYKKDKDGNIEKVKVNGVEHPVEIEVASHYANPVDFKATIALSGGEAEAVEFGIDTSAYSAVITAPRGKYPLNEKSLVWYLQTPRKRSDGTVDESSAEYRVVKVSPTLQYDRFVLAKRVDNNGK